MTPTKSKCIPLLLAVAIISAMDGQSERAAGAAFEAHVPYLGFDRNCYPGDQYIPLLRKTFRFTGYWLNVPPGATTNTWVGKRAMLQAAGFGFAVLFNGRLYQEIRSSRSAEELGKKDAAAAITACMREGFHRGTVIFSIRRKAAECCRNSVPTCTPGWMALTTAGITQACIAPPFRHLRPAEHGSSQP